VYLLFMLMWCLWNWRTPAVEL